MKKFVISDISELSEVSRFLISCMSNKSIFLIYGDLGAGKTTLVKEWMNELGIKDEISSPTYSIVNEYKLNDRSVFHMDMYRLKTIDEAIDIGIEEYLDNINAYSIIEWPALILDLIVSPVVKINIEVSTLNQRVIQIEA